MRRLTTILLLNVMLVPLVWNGVSFIHHLVEHTHTFCESELDHQHTSSEDCHTICHIATQHDQSQVPHKIEFYELKNYVTVFPFLEKQFSFSNSSSTNSEYALLYSRILSEDIFRPPIS